VLYLWHERGRGKRSGVAMDQRGATVVTLRDGRITHLRAYVDRADAFAAVGLSAWTATPPATACDPAG
jgi:ketosteroid isomerase-like protein